MHYGVSEREKIVDLGFVGDLLVLVLVTVVLYRSFKILKYN